MRAERARLRCLAFSPLPQFWELKEPHSIRRIREHREETL